MAVVRRLSSAITTETGFTVIERELSADYPLHWHEFYEIEYILSGSGTFYINDVAFPARPQTLFFMTPLDFQRITVTEPIRLLNLMFEERRIHPELLDHLTTCAALPDFDPAWLHRLREEAAANRTWNALFIDQLLGCILIEVSRGMPRRPDEDLSASLPPAVRQALRLIRLRFRDDITLESVAAAVGFSPSYFSTLFHRSLGTTFVAYLASLRLDYAAKLLKMTDLSVTDVCFYSGFNNFSHFLRSFKARYGLSPLTYRKRHPASATAVFHPPAEDRA